MVLHPNRCFSTQRDGFTPKQVLLYTDRWFWTITNGFVPRHIVHQLYRWFSTLILYSDRWFAPKTDGSVPGQMVLRPKQRFCTQTDGSSPKQMVLFTLIDGLAPWTLTKIPLMYSFSGNSAASAPISTFMCLWAICIVPGSVYILPPAE